MGTINIKSMNRCNGMLGRLDARKKTQLGGAMAQNIYHNSRNIPCSI